MKPTHWFFLIAVCMLPRAVGVAVNREANDDHVQVVELWLQQGQYPDESACWECFQPPLYSTMQYAVARVLDLRQRESLIACAQAINGALSVFILGLLAWQIQRFPLPVRWKMVLFLFVALNPKLVAINVQATNDTLLITLGMAMLNSLHLLVRRFDLRLLAVVWGLAFLAAITKGNGLVLLVIACGTVTWVVMVQESFQWLEKGLLLALFLVSLPSLAAEVGFYRDHYERNGTPFSINQPKAPPANWVAFDGYTGKRLGVRSIADCFLTFRLVDLMRHPNLADVNGKHPEHRTSFFTLLYGQAFHSQFEYYPISWQSRGVGADWVARGLFVLGLVPMGVLGWGMVCCVGRLLRQEFGMVNRRVSEERKGQPMLTHRVTETTVVGVERADGGVGTVASTKTANEDRSDMFRPACWFYPMVWIAFLVFLVKYSLDYRDYANIKLIFLFPAIPALVTFWATGVETMVGTRGERWLLAILGMMCVGFVANLSRLLVGLVGGG